VLVQRCLEGDLELVVSEQLLAELERALAYPKIRTRIKAEEAEEFVALLRRAAELAVEQDSPPRRTADPGDDYLVALAAAARAALVSGDQHLLALAGELPIYAARDVLDLLD